MKFRALKRLSLIPLLGTLAIFQHCQTSSLTATQSVQMGDAMNNQNRYVEAIKYYESYLDTSPALGVYRNYELESEVCRKLAHVYSTQGQHNRSLDYLRKAYKLDSGTNKNLLKVAENLRLMGVTYTYLGDYPKAINYLNQSLEQTAGMEASAKSVRKLAVADTYLSLAHVQLAMGDLDPAMENADYSLEIYSQLPNEYAGAIEAYLIKGNLEIIRHELGEALVWIKKSKKLSSANNLSIARQLQSESEIHRLKGELEASLRKRLESLEEADKSGITPQVVWAYLRIGDAYNDLGDNKRALDFYQKSQNVQVESDADTSSLLPSIQLRLGDLEQAKNFWNRSGSSMGVAIISLKLGQQFLAGGQIDSAYSHFTKAQNEFLKAQSNEGLARSKAGLSRCLIEQSQYGESLSVIKNAMGLSAQPDIRWQLAFQKGLALEKMGEVDSAISAYLESTEIIEQVRGTLTVEEFRSSFFEDKTIVYDRLINVILKKGGLINYLNEMVPAPQLAFQINEKARSRTFLDMLGNKKIKPKTITDENLLDREQKLRLKIQQLSIQIQRNEMNGLNSLTLLSELEVTQDNYRYLIEEIKLKNNVYNSVMPADPPSLSSIQAVLDDKTLLVEYWIGEENAVAWVIGSELFHFKILNTDKTQLVREVKLLRNGIRFNLEDHIRKSLSSLYSQLIKPVKNWMEPYENIGIIPHGPLHFLPFQALMNKNNRHLVSDKNIFYNPSASIYHLTALKKDGADEKVLSLALGDHGIGDHNPLPGTEFEVSQIAQFYEQYTPRYRENSSETFFKENAPNYNLIHLATHGILSDKQPLYSYLLMSPSDTDDGRLTVNEIMDLDLQAKLITLSACETGLGDLDNGDELIGLSRAFLYAGTSSVIVSLWSVDDLSTSFLMTKFHQFLKEGQQSAVALSMAQRELLKQNFQLSDSRGKELQWHVQLKKALGTKNRFNSNPYYWAPFILVGNGL